MSEITNVNNHSAHFLQCITTEKREGRKLQNAFPTVKYRGGCIMFWDRFAVGGTGVFQTLMSQRGQINSNTEATISSRESGSCCLGKNGPPTGQ